MPKIAILVLAFFLITAERSFCDEPTLLVPGKLYAAMFIQDYRNLHSMDQTAQYVIKIDAISTKNPNWVQVEFPPAANSSYTSALAGKRWVNLNYIMELQDYVAP